jgi:HAE1 family hydrophobic/amphiphilic exporter-1
MRFLAYWIYHPVGTSMGALVVFLLGMAAFLHTPVDLLPSLETPRITICTSYPHATPREVEQSITEPLEKALAGVQGLRRISSSSSEGGSYVVGEFFWGTSMESTLEEVRERVRQQQEFLPKDAGSPLVRRFDSQAIPLMMLSYATSMDPYHAREYLDSHVMHQLERIPGVSSALLWGEGAREVRVDLDVYKMKDFGISVSQLLQALREANLSSPGGSLARGDRSVGLRIPGKYTSLEEIRDTVISHRQGHAIPLRAFAGVTFAPVERPYIYRVNRNASVQLTIYKGSGENTVAVADRIYEVLERINRELPGGELVVLFDSSRYIRESLSSVVYAGIGGGCLALGVLFLFLRSLGATLVVAAAVPFSVAACFGLMRLQGFSLNIMSLGGLALGLGMLVDNAVVVLENIHRKRRVCKDPAEAALEGSREMVFPILGGTLTTGAVFLPLFFFQGMSGILFRELGSVVMLSLLASLVVALTLVPMLSRFLLPPLEVSLASLGEVGGILGMYEGLLAWIFRHPRKGGVLFLAGTTGVLLLLPHVGSELVPPTDESELRISFSMQQGTPLETREGMMMEIEKVLEEAFPEIRILQCAADRAASGGVFRLGLAPRGERSRGVQEMAEEVHHLLQKIPGIQGRVRIPSSILGNLLGGSGEQSLSVEIRGFDPRVAGLLGEDVVRRAESLRGVTDASLGEVRGIPEYRLLIDREKASSLGMKTGDIAREVRFLLAGGEGGEFFRGGSFFPLRLLGEGLQEKDMEEFLQLPLGIPGHLGELGNVATSLLARAPLAISRKDRQRVRYVTIAAPSRSPGDLLKDLRIALEDLPFPEGYTLSFGGAWEEQSRAFRELYRSILLALLLVYMILACQFESLLEPLLVMTSVPLSMLGVILVLFLTDTTWNLQSLMGCLVLTGVGVNNALLLVYQGGYYEKKQGFSPKEAATRAARERLRPILMTSCSTGIALVPLALGWGGEMQAPLARAVIGGLLSSTLISLLGIPPLYEWLRRKGRREQEKRAYGG